MDEGLRFVTWKWNGNHWKKPTPYTAQHVNVLLSMLRRHYQAPFELVCITDDRTGLDPEVRAIPIWEDFRELGRCWRLLKVFSPEMREIIGPRFVCIDLDTVVVDDVTSMFSAHLSFRIWGEYWRRTPYCASLMMMDAGARAQVWEDFPAMRKYYQPNEFGRMPYGSDQDHITRCLFPFERMWTMADGVFNFNYSVRRWDRFALGGRSNSKYHTGHYAQLYEDATGRSDWPRVIRRPALQGPGGTEKSRQCERRRLCLGRRAPNAR